MRTLGFVLGLVIPSLLLVVAPAVAQVPGQAECTLQLSPDAGNPPLSGFSANEERTYQFTIQNEGALEARGTFTVNDPRPGWFWSSQDRQVVVPPQGGEPVTMTVSVLFEGERPGPAQLDAQVTEVSCGPAGVQGTPSETISLSLSHAQGAIADPSTSGGEDGGIDAAWWVFGAIVLGTAVAVPVVYTRRGPNVEVTCEEAEGEVVAGRGTSFPVRLKNKGSDPVRVDLEVADVQEGWSALTTLPDLELAGKESRTIYLMVRAPAGAKQGDLCVAKLAVTPEGGSAKTVKTLTRVDKGAGDEESPPEPAGGQSEPEDR